ncbi:MAG: helix-turn-helix domain-containing protein [Deltaproteobacteria bacterium]|nr:helix-turn-helix domain-containing protein [Deltaproteobacteria bacterium]
MANISKIKSEEVESIGAYLKHQRELRGIPLEEISKHSLIRMEFLQAIEQEQFVKLPGLAFAKGYLRAYANYIGLDAEDVLLRFESRYAYLKRDNKKLESIPWLSIFLSLVVVIFVVILLFFLVKE